MPPSKQRARASKAAASPSSQAKCEPWRNAAPGQPKKSKTLITGSVVKVEDGTGLVHQAGQTMQEIVTSVKRVTDIMAEIAAASAEQTSGIEQVNQAIVQMDQVTQQNAALVEEAAAATESMQQQSRSLITAVATFKLGAADRSTSYVHAEAGAALEHPKEDEGAGEAWDGATVRRRLHRAKNVVRLPLASA